MDNLERLEKVLKKGVRMVQLREKQISGHEYYRLALKVREMTKDNGALLFINDRVDIALLWVRMVCIFRRRAFHQAW